MTFTNEVSTLRGDILNNILTTGVLMPKNNVIRLIKPFVYDEFKIVEMDKFGTVTVIDSNNNRLDVSLKEMEIEILAGLADHLMNPRNYTIEKNE